MSEAMIVQGTALQIKEYRGKRVVTFKDIDTVHKRPDGTAKRNFDNNRSHFISGVDFFKIPMKEFSTNIVPNSYKGGNPNNLVTLITETGYLMLVKSFTDDLAWKVQRELVDSYFRVNEGFVEQTVTVTETPSDIYMEASKIVAGCIEGNRPYVLNILRHLIPDIGYEDKEEVVEVPSVTTEITTETIPVQTSDNRCYKEPFNANQFNNYLIEHNIKVKQLAEETGLGVNCISRYKCGHQKPTILSRTLVCNALGLPADYFNNARRVRRLHDTF